MCSRHTWSGSKISSSEKSRDVIVVDFIIKDEYRYTISITLNAERKIGPRLLIEPLIAWWRHFRICNGRVDTIRDGWWARCASCSAAFLFFFFFLRGSCWIAEIGTKANARATFRVMRTLVCFVFVNVHALSILNARRGYIGVEKLVLIYFQRISYKSLG